MFLDCNVSSLKSTISPHYFLLTILHEQIFICQAISYQGILNYFHVKKMAKANL